MITTASLIVNLGALLVGWSPVRVQLSIECAVRRAPTSPGSTRRQPVDASAAVGATRPCPRGGAASDSIVLRSRVGVAATAWSSVTSDVDALAPEFRTRLDRVVDRMRDQFGHQVVVTETRRTQSRQDALYGQGRTRKGPVVTWTRRSAHLVGDAADVVVDRSYAGGLAYTRLGEIAREEGLRTLGPRDPGHLELAGTASRPMYASAVERVWARSTIATAGSPRVLGRIRSSDAPVPRGPTVFAVSPYTGVMLGTTSFVAVTEP